MGPTRESLRHREAFEFYYLLGSERSLEKVARKYVVTNQCTALWSARFGWQKRIAERDARISERVVAKTDEGIVEAKSKQLKISRAVIGEFARYISRIQQREEGLPLSPSEIVKIMAHEMKLLGDKAFIDPSISINNPTINIQKEKSLIAVFGQMLPEQKEKIMLALGRLGNRDGVLA